MLLLENLSIALRSLRANLLRSMLTTLGIIIGTAAVIAVVSIIQGLQYMVTGELEGLGATFISVSPQFHRHADDRSRRAVRLTWEDGEAIRDRVPGIVAMTPVVAGNLDVKYNDRSESAFVIGSHESWPEVRNENVDRGRFFSRFDVDRRQKVAVVGAKLVEELRLGSDPIGKEIYVGSLRAAVVGVMEKKGETLGIDFDNRVMIPFDTALSLFGRSAADLVELNIQARNPEVVDQVADNITALLRQRHKLGKDEKDDFQVVVQEQIVKIFTRLLGGITAVISAIVSVALIVGGIGIMNIMLVSVTERTREIGVRKSVGARRRDIMIQFLIEAVALSLLGGLIGVAAGYGTGVLAIAVIPYDLPPAHVPFWAVALAFGFSSFVGVVFGLYPASKAANLDPIEALRYE